MKITMFKKLLLLIALVCSIGSVRAQSKNVTAATFPGGLEALYKFLAKNVNYPETAKKHNVQGKVFLSFNVEENGSLTNIKVMKGIGSGCDEEAVRVIKQSPKWNPGKKGNQLVRQSYTIPIQFSLKS